MLPTVLRETLFVDLSSTSLPSLLPSLKPTVSKTIKYLCRCFFRKEICVTWEESYIMQDDLLDCLIYLLWWQSIFHCVCYVDIAMYINIFIYMCTHSRPYDDFIFTYCILLLLKMEIVSLPNVLLTYRESDMSYRILEILWIHAEKGRVVSHTWITQFILSMNDYDYDLQVSTWNVILWPL